MKWTEADHVAYRLYALLQGVSPDRFTIDHVVEFDNTLANSKLSLKDILEFHLSKATTTANYEERIQKFN